MEIDVEARRVTQQLRQRGSVAGEVRVRDEDALLAELEVLVGEIEVRPDRVR